MSLRGLISNEKFLVGFLAVNLYMIWLAIYFPYFESSMVWFVQVTIEVILIYLSVFYAYFVLVPKFLYTQKYLQFILGILLLITIQTIVVLSTCQLLVTNENVGFWEGISQTGVERIFTTRLLWVIAAVAVKVYVDQIKMGKTLSDALHHKTKSDLEFLKSQIAPHFLFNGLNTIFFQIAKENSDARSTIGIFSSLLRYQLYESQKEKVQFVNEVNYLKELINFYRIRMGDKIQVTFEHSQIPSSAEVHPLLLSPLIENAFKYVSLSDTHPNIITVSIVLTSYNVLYEVSNTTFKVNTNNNHNGIGLLNLRKRLELVYPERHELKTWMQDGLFKAELKLTLDKR